MTQERGTDQMDETLSGLLPYVPRLLATWPNDLPAPSHRSIEGSMLFADISGFTNLSERLARQGKVGAEELVSIINGTFAQLLSVAYAEEGGLLKFGGDALLLFFSGEGHPLRAARAAGRMRRTLKEIGKIATESGSVTLRISMGIHSDVFDFYLVGLSHEDLLIAGPATSQTVVMEQAASAGEILLSPSTAGRLPDRLVGDPKGPGLLLKALPKGIGTSSPQTVKQSSNDVSRFIPAAVRRHLMAGGEGPAHRQVTIMFLHFDGVDALHGEFGPEGVCAALHDLVSTVQRAADQHLVSYLDSDIDLGGGKIYLAAGAPFSEEDDEGRMLLASLAIRDGDPSLPVKMGINRGHVFTGDIGPSYRKTYTFMGDAVNLAARVMSRADEGSVLATRDVIERAGTSFDTEPVEAFSVKGKSRPVDALAVIGPAGRRAERRSGSVFVGRAPELKMLTDAWEKTLCGAGASVEIRGEAGIGKTRLIETALGAIHPRHIFRVTGIPHSASTPYGALRAPLREALDIPQNVDGSEAQELLTSHIEKLHPGSLPWLPLIAVPLGLHVQATSETKAIADEFLRSKIAWAVTELLSCIWSSETVLVLEDAHWVDEATFDLFREASLAATTRPWLVIVCGRDLSGRPADVSLKIELGPLSEQETASLLDELTADSPLLPHTCQDLAARSGGHPLFLEELLASQREGIHVPDSLESAITIRIDRLPPGDRKALRRLAVLGPSYSLASAKAVLPDAQPFPPSKRLGGFVVEDGRNGRFLSSLVREGAYNALPFSQRRSLHLTVAQQLEASADDRDPAELSFHFFAGKDYEKAWSYSVRAGDQAKSIFSNLAAATLYERALDASRWLPDLDQEKRLGVSLELADALFTVGEFHRSAEVLASARRLTSNDPVKQAQLISKQVRIPWRTGRLSDAIRWLRKGLKVLDGIGSDEADRIRAKLWAWMASIRHEQGKQREAIALSELAITYARAAGDKETLAQASSVLDVARVAHGIPTDLSSSMEAMRLYEDLGELAGKANILINLGAYAYLAGRWEEAIAHYEEARHESHRMGNAAKEATTAYNIAEILTDQGRLDEAADMVANAERVWRAADDKARLGFAQSLQGRIAYLEGRHDDARTLLGKARSTFEFAGAASRVIFVDALSAEAAIARGEPQEALKLVDACLSKPNPFEAMLHRIRGQALLGTDPQGARIAFDAAIKAATERGETYEIDLIAKASSRLTDMVREPEERLQSIGKEGAEA